MTSIYAPLTCADTLVLTDHGTHKGRTGVRVWRRADGTYLTVRYYDTLDVTREASGTLPRVRSDADEGWARPARGQDFVTAYPYGERR